MNRFKVARIVSVPEAFVHFKAFLRMLKERGAALTLVSSPGKYEDILREELNLEIQPIEICREINVLKDLKALTSLILVFRKNCFDIIHSSTPKAGLLTAIAGVFSTRSIRLHTFTGQRWANMHGLKRIFFKFTDKVIIGLNTQCYADSNSQIEFLASEGVAPIGKIRCLHKGSYGGVDCDRFNNERFPAARDEVRKELGLATDSLIILYVGQLTSDKGLDELVKAYRSARSQNGDLKLVLIGVFREGIDSLEESSLNEIKMNSGIYSLGYKPYPEKYFSAADIFCLPSHREGFGTVIIEAAACGLPAIGTNIPGLRDAIVDGETGILVEVKNAEKLSAAILSIVFDPQKRKQYGNLAKLRARKDFDAKMISEMQWEEYKSLLKTHSQ